MIIIKDISNNFNFKERLYLTNKKNSPQKNAYIIALYCDILTSNLVNINNIKYEQIKQREINTLL